RVNAILAGIDIGVGSDIDAAAARTRRIDATVPGADLFSGFRRDRYGARIPVIIVGVSGRDAVAEAGADVAVGIHRDRAVAVHEGNNADAPGIDVAVSTDEDWACAGGASVRVDAVQVGVNMVVVGDIDGAVAG